MQLSVLAALLVAAAGAERPKLVMPDFAALGGLDPSIATLVTESTAIELGRRGVFTVITAREIQTLLGLGTGHPPTPYQQIRGAQDVAPAG